MAAPSIQCTSCGTSNPADRPRCVGCGAKVVNLLDSERAASRSVFAPKWLGVGVALYAILLVVVIVVPPFVISAYDPQGLAGIFIAMAIWALGGFAVGALAKDGRLVEPSLAALLTALAIIPYIAMRSDVYALTTGSYVSGGVLGILAAFMGAFFGDKLVSKAAR